MNKKLLMIPLFLILLTIIIGFQLGEQDGKSGEVKSQILPEELPKLNVKIFPEECKLYPSQTQLFHVVVYNGTKPFTYKWESNGTFLSNQSSLEFGFSEPCNYTILSVTVWDSDFGYGYDSVLVYDPAFESQARYFEIPASPYSSIIETNSTHYAWYNGSIGKRQEISTNATAIINNGYGNLTSGRTWKETIAIKGNFTIDSTILVPSYSYSDWTQARITLDSSVSTQHFKMIQNENYGVSSDTEIEIHGGIIDGNMDNIVANIGTFGLYFNNVSHSLIEGLDIINQRSDNGTGAHTSDNGFALKLYNCEYTDVTGCLPLETGEVWVNTNSFPQTLYTIDLNPNDSENAGTWFFVENNWIHGLNTLVKVMVTFTIGYVGLIKKEDTK